MYEQIVTGALFIFILIFEQCELGQQQQIKDSEEEEEL